MARHKPLSDFGSLILSECSADGRAWLAALASISQGLFATSSDGGEGALEALASAGAGKLVLLECELV